MIGKRLLSLLLSLIITASAFATITAQFSASKCHRVLR